LDGLEMESGVLYFRPLVCFKALWYILWSFGSLSRFGMLYKEKFGNTAQDQEHRPGWMLP
jgi:hypothetical protein